MKLMQMMKTWVTRAKEPAAASGPRSYARTTSVLASMKFRRKIGMADVEQVFDRLKVRARPIMRYVAVLCGTTRDNPATVVFEYPSRCLKCGTLLTARDGRKYVVVEKRPTGRTTLAYESYRSA